MAEIAVVGPGSVGLFFAGHLAAAGHDVISCARRSFDRYLIESPESPLDLEANVVTDPAEVDAPVEWVLVCVKAHQTEGAAGWLDKLCNADTKVMVLQNGIEHDRVEPFANGATTIPSVVVCRTELIEPGHIRHARSGTLTVPAEPCGDEMSALFADSKAELLTTANFATHSWRKLGFNVMLNGITALTGRTIPVIDEPGIRPIAVSLLEECWQVAQARGAHLDPADAAGWIDRLVATGVGSGTSMLYDTLAGRPTEHDAIHGAALRAAAAENIDVPTIAMIHALLDARRPGQDPFASA